jgi:hypothetical protein
MKMKIKELFVKDIFRAINGVIKADQQDSSSIWQELDEFVVTNELSNHLDKFFSVYADTVDNPKHSDASGKIGVWVSGFFGSGKSHFIKALYYLFANTLVEKDGVTKSAPQFFENKIQDAMLLGTVKRVVGKNVDAILFNIDSRADQSRGRDAILAVFLKVLNELQGYSPDHPHIAHMERYLDSNGALVEFEKNYKGLTGEEWRERRVDWQFNQDEIVKSLAKTLGQSDTACHRWIDHAETDFSLTVENFAKWVKEYLDKKGANHRLFFFVDEIGQFIGQDGHLMLNLQTIVENLGTVCRGQAWVIVTSQEDIDTVVGSLSNTRRNDFSKITGRFKTRLSLSSANTDEVIQRRLLEKKDTCGDRLKKLYTPCADILKNQLTFSSDTGMTLPSFKDSGDFVATYPFIPYQFKLLQKVFETIRRAGATGLHLSRGERSMLDAFQFAAQKAAEKDLGVLIPLYWFYPSIESFLDTSVKRTIDQAGRNPSLHNFDISILQTLFMIRYVEEVKGNVDNLVTLCIDSIDADRLALRKEIEQALGRLEKETLIARSGENFYFLTNEEQDISREIKNVDLGFGDESRELSRIIFEDIYRDDRKHRYAKTGKDFDLTRICDMNPHGGRVDKGLVISVISSFYDEYGMFGQHRCIGESTNDNGSILIKLPESDDLSKEIRVYLKTEKYIARKNDGNPEVRRILDDRKSDNRQRKARLIETVKGLLAQAEIYINGQIWNDGSQDALTVRSRVLDYLVDNTFSKMGYIDHPCANPQNEIQSVLRHDDTAQRIFDMNIPDNNPRAIKEVREYISLCAMQSRQIVMGEIVDRFSVRPYGWNEWETVLIVSKVLCLGEIQLEFSGAVLEKRRVNEVVQRTSNWKKITVRQRKLVDSGRIEEARKLGQTMFGEMGPDKELQLFEFLRNRFNDWQGVINECRALAQTGKYPGLTEIQEALRLAAVLLSAGDSFDFINRFIENRDALVRVSQDFADIEAFYTKQRVQWDELCSALDRFEINRFDIEKNDTARQALCRMREIKTAPAPYGIIREASALIRDVEQVNNDLLNKARSLVEKRMDELADDLEKDATSRGVAKDEIEKSRGIFGLLKDRIKSEQSIANIRRFEEEAKEAFERELNRLIKTVSTGKETIKEVKTVSVRSLSRKAYLDTEKDVDDYADALRNELKKLIKEGKRIKVD